MQRARLEKLKKMNKEGIFKISSCCRGRFVGIANIFTSIKWWRSQGKIYSGGMYTAPSSLKSYIPSLLQSPASPMAPKSVNIFHKKPNLRLPPSKLCNFDRRTSGHSPVPSQNPIHPPSKSFLIIADSLTTLSGISNDHSFHPVLQRIHILLATLSSIPLSVTFVWVPSHRSIQGNEAVDSAAKAATNLLLIRPNFLPTKSYLNLFIRNHITNHWINLWQKQAP